MYSVEELAIFGDTFYALAGMGNGKRLFRWRKGEQFWTHISPDIGFGPNDYLNSNDRGFALSGETVYFYRKGEFMRSHDKGNTWSKIEAFPLGDGHGREIEDLAVLGKSTYITVSESGEFWSPLGVFRSLDHGMTWESANEGLPQPPPLGLDAFGNALFATGEKGIFRIKNDQDSWEFVKPSIGFMISLLIADSTLYAGTGGWGVHRIALDD
jgi:hypothetical protein